MKILRVIGFGLCIVVMQVLVPEIWNAISHAVIVSLGTVEGIMAAATEVSKIGVVR